MSLKRVSFALLLLTTLAQAAVAGLEEAHVAYQQGNYAFSAAEWKRLAQQNNAQAQHLLGKSYANGQGVEQDYRHAFAWFSRAAEQGHAQAQNDLAGLYTAGNGIVKDYKRAFAWYARAAQQNNAQAQNNLGILYGLGKGVDRNPLQSYQWLNLAKINGYEKAITPAEKLAKTLTSEQLMQAEVFTQAWLRSHHE